MQVTKQTIRRAVIVATTMTKGLKGSEVTGEMIEGWYAKATAHQMTDEGFLAAFDAATDNSTFFPSWHEVLTEYRKAEHDASCLILDPVTVQVSQIGVSTIGSESLLRSKLQELDSLPELTQEQSERRSEIESALIAVEQSAPELPSPESREAARARLESALESLPVKRIRPARERAKFVDVEDNEAIERRSRMLSDVRGKG